MERLTKLAFKIPSIFLIFFFTSNYTIASNHNDGVLRYDGLYQSSQVKNYWYYLRFYADGTVITVSSTGTPVDVKKWFTSENVKSRNFSHGKYELTESHIFFSSKSRNGIVDYEGDIEGAEIDMNVHSHINGAKIERKFYFVPFEK